MSARSYLLRFAAALTVGAGFAFALSACAPSAASNAPSALAPQAYRAAPTRLRRGQPLSSYAQLYSFAGNAAGDGSGPNSGLVNIGGTLYGTTDQGGSTGCGGSGCGTVFKITPAGSETVLHAFGGGTDGAHPIGLVDLGGTLYGTTIQGGSSMCDGAGCGTVFKITTTGTETVLYAFQGEEGFGPSTGLVAIGGVLYGATGVGGYYRSGCPEGCGTIYSITKSGKVGGVYQFHGGSDGMNPNSLDDIGGTLYGTTNSGGGSASCFDGCGTAFQVTTAGSETVLHAFGNGIDGQYPAGGLIDVAGTLYGATFQGGSAGFGTVFKIAAGAESVLYNFECGADGGYPVAGLTKVGSLFYGTTAGCGTDKFGTIYKMTKTGAETVLYDFAGVPDGDEPQGLTNLGGTLYGTAELGGTGGCGSLPGCGTVFTFTP